MAEWNRKLFGHGTLFAGRSAEWFVESAFVAAAHQVPPENIVCVQVHGMHFSRPVNRGDVVRFSSRLVHAGRTSLVAHAVLCTADDRQVVDGFVSFVHVDADGRPQPHGLSVHAVTDEERRIQEQARALGQRT